MKLQSNHLTCQIMMRHDSYLRYAPHTQAGPKARQPAAGTSRWSTTYDDCYQRQAEPDTYTTMLARNTIGMQSMAESTRPQRF
jgi:hypothetical protein